MKNALLILVILINTLLRADVPGFKIGVIAKGEWNIASAFGVELNKRNYQSRIENAGGLYIWKGLGHRFALNGSVLLSRARYDINYTEGANTFLDADIRFTQTNLNLEYLLNPGANAVWYLFGGGQHLYRRWGEERYVNAVIDKTYWPANSLQTQAGLGVHIKAGPSIGINVFAGIRNAMTNQVLYQSGINQIFTGVALTWSLQGKQKNKFGKCPSEF